MRLEFYTLDVFSFFLFGGNPLAVFHNANELSEDIMQKIAAEINYSETVFIQKPVNENIKIHLF